VNSTMIQCKNFCICHNVPSVQQQCDNKNVQTKNIENISTAGD
jgi:hypothetical protein